jgi:acetyl-CoA acetyltransferase
MNVRLYCPRSACYCMYVHLRRDIGMRPQLQVLGGAQTDFAVKWQERSDVPLRVMLQTAVESALEDAALDPADIEVAHVGNFVAERFSGQAHLGPLLATFDPAWESLPTSRHEGACASGSLAILAAMADIEAGRYDVALVAGEGFGAPYGARISYAASAEDLRAGLQRIAVGLNQLVL